MKHTLKKSLCLLIALITVFSCVSSGFSASAVGKASGLKATAATENSITLSWSKVSDADGYRIYRYNSSTKKWVGIKNTTALTYTDKSLTAGTVYSYGIRAIDVVDGKYVYGEASNIISTLTLPGQTKNLRVGKSDSSSITLKWDKASGATGYELYYKNASVKKFTRFAVTSATEYTIKNLKAGASFTFAVRAYAKNGSAVTFGKASNNLTASAVLTLAKVQNLRLDAFNEKAYRIRWDAVNGALGYQVGIYDFAAKKWKSLGTTTKTYATLNASNRTDSYRYVVRAYAKGANGYIFGALSDEALAFAKPLTPTGLQGAENSNRGISLKWNKVAGASGYEVHSYDAINGKWVYVGSTTSNSYNINNLTQTSHYKYKICAYKVSGNKKFFGDFCESVTVNFHAEESDSIYSEELEKSGIFGYLYDPSGKYFYTADDPWQRNVGYNSIFDTAAPLTFIDFDTVRLRFPYGDKDWMIQLWKGQYGLIFYGAEVGIYTKPKDRVLMHYDCATDDEMLKMSMVFNEYKNGSWQQRFTRPYGYYWWCTGFLPGNKAGNFSVLKLDMRITAKDYDMLKGIKTALEENSIDYKVSGLDVYFTFS